MISFLEEIMGLKVIVVNDNFALRYFDHTLHGGILLDDANIKNLTREELINLLDYNSRTIKVRYGHIEIPGNTPKAIKTNQQLTNINEFFNLDDEAYVALKVCNQYYLKIVAS